MKYCGRCDRNLSEDSFSINNSRKDGLQSYCISCMKEARLEHYEKKKDYYRNQVKSKKDYLKEFVKRFKNICKCSVCGEDRGWLLDFHHCNGEDKLREVAYMYKYGSINSLKKEIRKCKVLCANCHRDLHYQEKQL